MLALDPGNSGQMKDWEEMPILMIYFDHVCVSWEDIRSKLQGMSLTPDMGNNLSSI